MLPETLYAAEWDTVGVDMAKDHGSAVVNVENVEEGKSPIVATAAKSSESIGSLELWKAPLFLPALEYGRYNPPHQHPLDSNRASP